MEQAIVHDDIEERADADDIDNDIDIDADEVIDAFDHVLESLDQVIVLAEFARSRGPEAARR